MKNTNQNRKQNPKVSELIKVAEKTAKEKGKDTATFKLLELLKLIRNVGPKVYHSSEVASLIEGEGKWFTNRNVRNVTMNVIRKNAVKVGKTFPKWDELLIVTRGTTSQFSAEDFE